MKDNLGFNDKYNYGIELEFNNDKKTLEELYELSKGYSLNMKYEINHNFFTSDYDKWIIDEDYTLTNIITKKHSEDELYYGGEASSKILKDTKDDWNEIKKVCEFLKDNSSYIDGRCSEHITVDVSNFYEDNKFFETFYKLLLIFENEIDTFYMGEKYLVRKNKSYASSISNRLLMGIDEINFDSKYFLGDILAYTCAFTFSDGVCFDKLTKKDGLIEIRYPNGTLDPNIIQNNINFTLSLIDSIAKENIDLDFLNYIISNLNRNDRNYQNKIKTLFKEDKFKYLVDNISNNKESKDTFNKQYKKIKTTMM